MTIYSKDINPLQLNLLPARYEQFETHKFDWENPILEENEEYEERYTDYKCKNCGVLILQQKDYSEQYYIDIDHELYGLTCNEILMKHVIE